MRRLLVALYTALVSFASGLIGRGKPAKNLHRVHGRLQLRRRPVQDLPQKALAAAALGHSLGDAELGIVVRVRHSLARKADSQPVVVLVLDLSSSIHAIAEEYAQGYLTFLKGLLGMNPILVLLGFDSKMKLLYHGPISEAPRYTAKNFELNTPASILGRGTALFRSIVTASLLATELQQRGPVTINWLTDGLDSRSDEQNPITLAMAVAACHVLARLKLSYQVLGIRNQRYSSSVCELEDLLRLLNPPVESASLPDLDLSRSMPTGRAFLRATQMVQESIRPGSSRTEINLEAEEDGDKTQMM